MLSVVLLDGGDGSRRLSADDSGSRSHTSNLRLLRVIRSIRLLRLVKMRRVIKSIKDRITSNVVRAVVNVFALLCVKFVFGHIMACCWFGLGVHQHSAGHESWISADFGTQKSIVESDVNYQYTTALHWSITQFSPASMEIVPQNTGERCYAVIIILFAMVMFSTFVSTLTSVITRITNTYHSKSQQFELLRRFLHSKNVSWHLSARVEQYLEYKEAQAEQRVEMQDVVLLNFLSRPLRMDLDFELYSPILSAHPFLQLYCDVDHAAMRTICSTSLSIANLSAGDVLFQPGEPCSHMYFVLEGALKYYRVEDIQSVALFDEGAYLRSSSSTSAGDSSPAGDPSLLTVGQWCCEAVLWVDQWHHQGAMRAETNCHVLLLNAEEYGRVTSTHQNIAPFARGYAQEFVSEVNLVEKGESEVAKDVSLSDLSMLDEYAITLRVAPNQMATLSKAGTHGLHGSPGITSKIHGLTRRVSAGGKRMTVRGV